MTSKPRKQKHIPQRTCVGCREVLSKRALVRIVRTPEGIEIDPTGKIAGRGAYLHERRSCWERALKGSIAQALKTNLSSGDLEKLSAYMTTLPELDDALARDETEHQQV